MAHSDDEFHPDDTDVDTSDSEEEIDDLIELTHSPSASVGLERSQRAGRVSFSLKEDSDESLEEIFVLPKHEHEHGGTGSKLSIQTQWKYGTREHGTRTKTVSKIVKLGDNYEEVTKNARCARALLYCDTTDQLVEQHYVARTLVEMSKSAAGVDILPVNEVVGVAEAENEHLHPLVEATPPLLNEGVTDILSGTNGPPVTSVTNEGATDIFPGTNGPPVTSVTNQSSELATRHARRVYVGGLSSAANEQSVATFFSQVLSAIGGNTAEPGDSVVNVYINHDKKFAFVEMRSVEEASNAMALDGIIFEGGPVKVRRPTDYNPSLALEPSQPNPTLNLAAVGLTPGSAGELEGPDQIFVGGLPCYITEAQIKEVLETAGHLRCFSLVKDRKTGNSKGYAFCIYQDLSVTDFACATLNGIKMGDKTLIVRRANLGTTQPNPEQENVPTHNGSDIMVVAPENDHLRYLIDTMALYVLDGGCSIEQAIMERGRGNPLFKFLFELCSKEHTYYVWRLYSLSQGDTLQRWRTEPFFMFTGSGRWIPPPLPAIQSPGHEIETCTTAAGRRTVVSVQPPTSAGLGSQQLNPPPSYPPQAAVQTSIQSAPMQSGDALSSARPGYGQQDSAQYHTPSGYGSAPGYGHAPPYGAPQPATLPGYVQSFDSQVPSYSSDSNVGAVAKGANSDGTTPASQSGQQTGAAKASPKLMID